MHSRDQRWLALALVACLTSSAGCDSRSLPGDTQEDSGVDGALSTTKDTRSEHLDARLPLDAETSAACPEDPMAVVGTPCEDDPDRGLCPTCKPSVTCCRQYLSCMGGTWQIMEAGPCGIPCGEHTCNPDTELCITDWQRPDAIHSYHCEKIPEGCQGDSSCACAGEALCADPFGKCDEMRTPTDGMVNCLCTTCPPD